jgi:hypothetical protein
MSPQTYDSSPEGRDCGHYCQLGPGAVTNILTGGAASKTNAGRMR